MKPSSDDRLVWLSGKLIPLSDARINILSPTAQFGANVFEGIRCYWNEAKQNLYVFRLKDHHKRLINSIKMLRMENPFSTETLQTALCETIRANQYREDIAVRQTVFIDGFGTWSSKGPVDMFVAPVPKARKHLSSSSGIRCCVSSWCRISDRNLSPRIKTGANYINSRMAQMEAAESGYDAAILMNDQGKIAEGPGSCLFIVQDGCLVTPPITASVLDSITRRTLMELAKDMLGIDTVVREIDRTELYICEEAFFCGSAAEITPIVNIDGYPIDSGGIGKISASLHDIYIKVATGEIDKYAHWLTAIYS